MVPAPTRLMKSKLFVGVFVFILIATGMIVANLFGISVVKAEYYRAKANNQQLTSFTLSANRGTIYDKNGKILAQSSTVWTVIMSPGDINTNEPENCELICRKLSEILGVDYDKLYKASQNFNSRYYIVKKSVEKAQADEILAFRAEMGIGVDSIYLNEESKRVYPNAELAASVIGLTNYDGEGTYGIEAYYDDVLTGTDGRVVMAKDASGNAMPYDYEQRYEAQDGNDVVLTIDEVLQHYLEKHLETTVSLYNVKERATGIIMNAKSGAILAMATAPGFDLNYPSTLSSVGEATLTEYSAGLTVKEDGTAYTKEEIDELVDIKKSELRETQWKNKSVSELYYPGSVFKVITCASALEEELVNTETSQFSCAGSITVAGSTHINCWSLGGHGTLDLVGAITASCNPAFITIGQMLGVDKFYNYFEAFGFTERTGIDLPGEASPLVVKRANMGLVELASSSFGQTNKITAVQMICACAAAINGGYLVTPYVVDKVLDPDGNVISTTETKIRRQVISEETSAQMREILESVVNSNGGSNAKISGYRIGGKSGTSQKMDVPGGDKLYVSSFCAFVPADDPEIIMLVIADQPTGGAYYGSKVAAPVVSAVFSESLEYLGIYAQYTAEEQAAQDTTVSYIIGKSGLAATTELNTKGLSIEFVGSEEGTTVLYTVPSAGSLIPRGGTVVAYMEEVDYLKTTVPDVTGYTVEQANAAMANAGLNIRLSGGAIENAAAAASSQSISAGEEVKKGTVVEVQFVINNETG